MSTRHRFASLCSGCILKHCVVSFPFLFRLYCFAFQLEVLSTLRAMLPGLQVTVPNASVSFRDQLEPVVGADLVITAHGAHAMPTMFMSPGSVVLEVFPWKFFYHVYSTHLKRCGVHTMALRANSVDMAAAEWLFGPQPDAKRLLGRLHTLMQSDDGTPLPTNTTDASVVSDVVLLRSTPTLVNLTSLRAAVETAVALVRNTTTCGDL